MPPMIFLYCDGVDCTLLHSWLLCILVVINNSLGKQLLGECKVGNIVDQYAVAAKNDFGITMGLLAGILKRHIDILVLHMCINSH